MIPDAVALIRFEYLSKLLGDLACGDAAVQTTTVARRAIAVAREDRPHIIRVHHQRPIPRHTGAVLRARIVKVGHLHHRRRMVRPPVAAVKVSHYQSPYLFGKLHTPSHSVAAIALNFMQNAVLV